VWAGTSNTNSMFRNTTCDACIPPFWSRLLMKMVPPVKIQTHEALSCQHDVAKTLVLLRDSMLKSPMLPLHLH
jgi:hypothetical protein